MKSLLRGFLAGFGFALGASAAGTLIGYGIGKLGDRRLGKLFSAPSGTSSPHSSSSPVSSPPTDDLHGSDHCRLYHVRHEHLPATWWCCSDGVCDHESAVPEHNRHYGARLVCEDCGKPPGQCLCADVAIDEHHKSDSGASMCQHVDSDAGICSDCGEPV